jgi:DNA repair photolyase
MQPIQPTIKGRGTAQNPPNRFERIHVELDPDAEEQAPPQTVYVKDATRSIIAHNDSPDIGFDASINPYRGCSHGCIYCYARPTHEYLGFSAGLDFESKILVKHDAPELLRAELLSAKWEPQVIGISGVTDCYQPVERKLQLTRRCLAVLAEFRNPVVVITKNHLVTRDKDILGDLASHEAALVCVSVTSLDADLMRIMEPRTSTPQRRLAAIAELTAAGIPVCVLVAPVIPGLTDHELPAIIAAAAKAGARRAGYQLLRLPYGVKDLFEQWVITHFPDRKEKILNRIRSMRHGKLNDANFHSRMRGDGIFAEQVDAMFKIACQKAGMNKERSGLSTQHFRRPIQAGEQLGLW